MNIPEIKEQITLSDGVSASLENKTLTIKGDKGELTRTFSHPKVNININNKIIEITSKNVRKKDKGLIGTFIDHIKNM
jgi:large subunit ribosomal protein L6